MLVRALEVYFGVGVMGKLCHYNTLSNRRRADHRDILSHRAHILLMRYAQFHKVIGERAASLIEGHALC